MPLYKICPKCGKKIEKTNQKYCSTCTKIIEEKRKMFEGVERPFQHLYNRTWKENSRRFLKENPICNCCGRPAEVVDHVIPHRGNEELFNDPGNWQPLCHRCHNEKTRQEIRTRKIDRNKLWY